MPEMSEIEKEKFNSLTVDQHKKLGHERVPLPQPGMLLTRVGFHWDEEKAAWFAGDMGFGSEFKWITKEEYMQFRPEVRETYAQGESENDVR